MRSALKSIAICVVVSISIAVDVFGADAATGSTNTVVVEQLGHGRFRLVNNSTEKVTYMHWMNQEDEPVAYCKSANGKIKPCSPDLYLLANGKPAEKETLLAAGKAINFKAKSTKTDIVGVSLLVKGEQLFLWQTQ
jgi:hypothetical protein